MKGYGNVFIIIIIFNKENESGNPITKIIRIPNAAFYLSFVYNIIVTDSRQWGTVGGVCISRIRVY